MGDDRRLVVAVPAQQLDGSRRAAPRAARAPPDRGRRVSASDAGLGRDVLELRLEPAEPVGQRPERASSRASDRSSRGPRPRPLPRAAGPRRSAPRARRAPRAIASPCCAAASRARDLVRLARDADAPPRSRPPRARASSSRRSSSRGSIASSASAARFARQRSTASAIAARALGVPAVGVEQVALPALVEQPLLVVLAVDLDQRRRRSAEPRRGDRLVVEARRRAPARADLADGDQRLGHAVEQRLDARASAPWRTSVVSARRARAPAPARRSAGSCRRRSRRSAR